MAEAPSVPEAAEESGDEAIELELPAPAPLGEYAISGVVLDADGNPATGAAVSGLWIADGSKESHRSLSAITGDDATFAFELPGAGPCRLRASRDRQYCSWVEAPAASRDIVLRLDRTLCRYQGIVLGPSGEPAAEARVWQRREASQDGQGLLADSSGQFESSRVEAGVYNVHAERPGLLASEVVRIELADGEERDGIVLRLREGQALLGRVVDEKGEPVAGARIQPAGAPRDIADAEQAVLGEREHMPGLPDAQPAVSDSEGEFRITGLPPGQRFVLSVGKERYFQDPGYKEVWYPAGTTGIVITLRPEASLSGRVIDREGRPLADLQVSFRNVDRPQPMGIHSENRTTRASHQSTRTAEDGRFRFGGLRGGRHLVWVTAPEHIEPPREEVVLAEGEQRTGLEFVLDAGVVVSGRVVYEDGEPLVGAQVWLENLGDDPGRRPQGRTDAEGHFEIRDARPGVLYRLSASARDGSGGELYDEGRKSVRGGQSVELVVRRLGVVVLQVTDEEGHPIQEAVDLDVILQEEGREVTRGGLRTGGRSPITLRSVPRELVAVGVDAEGYRQVRVPARFPPGEWEVDLGKVRLPRDGATLHGRVLGPDGAGVEGVRVSVGLSLTSGRSDAAGRYEIAPLPAGTYRVTTWHGEHPPAWSRVVIEGLESRVELDLQLEAGGVLTGTVQDPRGDPRSGVRARATRIDDPEVVQSTPVSGGVFRMVLAPGVYRLEVRNPGLPVPGAEQEVTITVGQETRVQLILEH